MKAIVQTSYGSPDLLELRDIERPTPADGEVLVRVRAASVHPDVWHVLTGLPYLLRLMGAGLRRPKNPVPGTDLAGVVESIGPNVTRFQPGDEVFGETIRGMQWVNGGAYAEYATAPEIALARKPARISFEEAAAVPNSGLIALSALRGQASVQAGHKVLVNGAGGGVGSSAVQLAKAFGAEVTGVDRTDKLEMIRSLGADHVLDYTKDDFTLRDERYDLIVDVPGNHKFADCARALTPEGKYVLIGHDNFGKGMHRWVGLVPRMMGLMARASFTTHLPKASFALPDKRESMSLLADLLESGKLTPHVDRAYPLAEIREALRHLQGGDVKGRIVLTM
jgi:NADPH:quinone reductase-like Zn-dependent oxidoreductase